MVNDVSAQNAGFDYAIANNRIVKRKQIVLWSIAKCFCISKLQVAHRHSVIDQLLERIDADANMLFDK
jgi:hypothetical protein